MANPGGMFPNRIRAMDGLLAPHITSLAGGGGITAAQFLTDFQVTGAAPVTFTLPTAALISAQIALGGENPVNYVYQHYIDNQNTSTTTFTTAAGWSIPSYTVAASTKQLFEWRFDPTGLLISPFNWIAPASVAGGTVTSLTQANSIVCTPNPIVGIGTIGVALSSLSQIIQNGNTASGLFLTFSATAPTIIGSDLTVSLLPSRVNCLTTGTYLVAFEVNFMPLSANVLGIYDQTAAAGISTVYGNVGSVAASAVNTTSTGFYVGTLTAGHSYSLRNLDLSTETTGPPAVTFPGGMVGAGWLNVIRLS